MQLGVALQLGQAGEPRVAVAADVRPERNVGRAVLQYNILYHRLAVPQLTCWKAAWVGAVRPQMLQLKQSGCGRGRCGAAGRAGSGA